MSLSYLNVIESSIAFSYDFNSNSYNTHAFAFLTLTSGPTIDFRSLV